MKEVEMERLLKALANRRRLALLYVLKRRREANVGELAETIKLSFTSTSKHLTQLERSGFIAKEQRSLMVWYRLAEDAPKILSDILRSAS